MIQGTAIVEAYGVPQGVIAHRNDRYVEIRRNSTFLQRAQNADTQDFFKMARVSVGSYFQKNSPAVGTGLTIDEVNLLLPRVLDMDADDREFRKEVQAFYTDLFTPVPENGALLNIGLTESNDKPLSEKNLPLNTIDYIRYRHALGHPWVAPNPETAKGNQRIRYYIFDARASENQRDKTGDETALALSNCISIRHNEDKVDMFLTLMDVDPVKLTTGKQNKLGTKQGELLKLAQTKSALFNQTFGKESFGELYLIKSLINAKIWNTVAGKIVDNRSNDIIADSEQEAIVWWKNPRNNQRGMIYRAALQDYLKRGHIPSWSEPTPKLESPEGEGEPLEPEVIPAQKNNKVAKGPGAPVTTLENPSS